MAEYIKRTRVMTICERYSNHCFEQNDAHGQNIADGIFDDIVDLPTEDVVPVVRCSQCIHYKKINFDDVNPNTCERTTMRQRPYDYCSCGERKDNNADKR